MLKALRDNLGLLALVVVLVGTSSTESYYGSFGLRYQTLSLSADHILYRGLTSTFVSAVVAVSYLAAMVVVAGQSRLALALGGVDRVRLANYAVVVLLACAAWWGGRGAGIASATRDMDARTSALPRMHSLSVKKDSAVEGIEGSLDGYRLLLQAGGGIYVLRPVNDVDVETPIIRFISGGAVEAYTLCTRC